MISSLSRITVPADASPDVVSLAQQYNNHIAELELQLASLQGSDGATSTRDSNIDMQGNRLTNTGMPQQNSDVTTQQTLIQKSAYRSTLDGKLQLTDASAYNLQVGRKVRGAINAVPLGQIQPQLDVLKSEMAQTVKGPASSIDCEIAIFDGITGKLIKGATNVPIKQNVELDATYGIILKSPNGTRFKITILDNGEIQRVSL